MNRQILLIITVIMLSCGRKPNSNFDWNPKNPKAGETVTFNNLSTDAKKYDWNLGNMKISSDKNPTNVYTQAGSFIVDLTARNGAKSATKTQTIIISP